MAGSDRTTIRTVTVLWAFEDPDGSVARETASGADPERFADRLVYTRRVEGNVMLDEGKEFLWRAATGAAGLVPFDSDNSYVGVGNSTAPESAGQTGLQGDSKYYKRVDSGFPRISRGTITFRATFGPDEANFDWLEWTVANGPSDDAVNLNRKVAVLGRKYEGSTWVLQVSITIS